MWDSDWTVMLNSTVPYTGGANVQGTAFSLIFFTVTALLLFLWLRNR
jgi:hypothetical protein